MGRNVELEICLGSSCFSRGNRDVVQYIKEYLKKNHLDDKVVFKGARCLGHCSNGPNLVINGKIIEGVSLNMTEKILAEYLSDLR
jgi:NADH:ubiquinone oxidoreductase subunit E